MRRNSMSSVGALVLMYLTINCLTASVAMAASPKFFRGTWGCSFKGGHAFFGDIAGVAQLKLDREGNLTGEEVISAADPHVEVSVTMEGKLFAQPNGMLRGVVNAHVENLPGVPDQPLEIVCVGHDRQGDRYRQMRCLDVFDEPAGTDSVDILECGLQD